MTIDLKRSFFGLTLTAIHRTAVVSIATLVIACGCLEARAITLSEFDDFEDGTTEGWDIGANALPEQRPINIPTGGPNGVDDSYMRYFSNGGPAEAMSMIIFNVDQWSGDYLAAGVNGIEAYINNLSEVDQEIEMRVAIGTNFRAFSGTWLASTESVVLAPGSGWTKVVFSLLEEDLTYVTGSAAYADVMESVAAVRILSSTEPDNRGDIFVSTVGFDNIRAVSIPEPTSACIFLGAVVSVLGIRQRLG